MHPPGAIQLVCPINASRPLAFSAPMAAGNISASEQRKRLLFGTLAIAAAFGWVLTGRAKSVTGAMVLFALFWFGILGLYQAKEKTCVLLAARGMRDAESGVEMILDEDRKSGLRKTARRIQFSALWLALALTALALWATR
jgi:hypothetical protein